MGPKTVQFTGGLLLHQLTGRALGLPLGQGLNGAVQDMDPQVALLRSR
ncbi:hypothetical protein HNQ08_002762 [Deinococcus humi]|uniref:Uncharacterized protein n=1 Tax=Deinococcus humi TaxID=662880 RepID=A0A7W8JXP5_9DEIO|nr:hypothetical protein [Deinococcus humi]